MQKVFVIILSIFLTVGAVDVSAQNLLKKLSNAVTKEVSKQVGKGIEKGLDKLTDGKNQQEQLQVQQPEQQQQSEQVQQPQPEQAPAQQAPPQEPEDQWWKKLNKPYAVKTIAVEAPSGPTSGTMGGHEWVDLGLPSGTRWATCNVDAASPEQPGKHYSWGEVATKTSYTEANAKYYKKDVADFSGNKAMDVATAKWGAGWRTPTKEEFIELLDYCNWSYLEMGGRLGAEFASRMNGKKIFLPATGSKEGTSISEPNGCGLYWTSTPLKNDWNNGAHQYHYGVALGEMGASERYYGLAVRPVADCDVKEKVETPSSGEIEGHAYVDLGLPSGLKWATCNIEAESADQDGEFFAWGQITPHKVEEGPKNDVRNRTYTIAGADKYDAATALWGGTWRIPMSNEFIELIENCTIEWISMGRRLGVKFTSKVNGNYIFFPASGSYPRRAYNGSSGAREGFNSQGVYWTSTPDRILPSNTYTFNISNSEVMVHSRIRYHGLCIRPVSE